MNYFEMKKRAFMSIVNSLKKFIRKVSGVPPLTLPDCVDDDSLISYSIEGEGVGDVTRNLFDLDLFTSDFSTGAVTSIRFFINADGNLELKPDGYASFYNYLNVKLPADRAYTLSIGYVGTRLPRIIVRSFDENDNNISSTRPKGTYNAHYIGGYIDNKDVYTLSADSSVAYYMVGLVASGSSSTNIVVGNIQLEEGAEATPYEPFGKYKIPIKMSGENIEPITTNIILDEPLAVGDVLEYSKDNLPKLPIVKGTTIYSVETEVQPSNMSVEYYSTRKD